MAQIIRYAMMFISFVTMIVISVVVLTFDQGVDRTTIVISAAFVAATIVSAFLLVYFIGNKERLVVVSSWVTKMVNRLISMFTFGKKKHTLEAKKVDKFFIDLHQDYLGIRHDKKILLRPLMWAVINNILDVSLIWVAFLALGSFVNPATLFIAFGLASFAAIFAATPGGTGVYEAIMIAFLVSAGVPGEVAIAGTLLARVTLFTGTILFGYIFYQLTINKYGKIEEPTDF
jgi:uncharacterized protein (TIRG00374 family)